MTVDELIAALQKLSAEGHGAKAVTVYAVGAVGYDNCDASGDVEAVKMDGEEVAIGRVDAMPYPLCKP